MALAGIPIVIDGAYGEAGASLVRTALAMATLTQQPLRIVNIRPNAKRPGLSSEDVAILRGLTASCAADVIGGEVGEKSMSFLPTRRPRGLNTEIEIPDDQDGRGHANALVVQNALLPVLARTGMYSSVTVKGETYGQNVLSFDYFAHVSLNVLRRLGLYAYPDLLTPGFGRGSRGEVALQIEPSSLHGIAWADRGHLIGIRAIISTCELPESVGVRGLSHLERLAFYSNITVDSEAVNLRGRSPGAFATVWAEFERGIGGATAMGARGVRMEAVVQSAFEGFSRWFQSDATLDPNVADQILLAACQAEGETHFRVSELTQRFMTVAWVIKQFLPIHITIKGQEGQPGSVTIKR